MLAISYPNHICYFGFMCVQLSAGGKRQVNMKMCRYAAWRGSMWITALAHLSESTLTFPSILLALLCSSVRSLPACQTGQSFTHSLRDSCEGHPQWIMRSQKHLKGHVVWRQAEERSASITVWEAPCQEWSRHTECNVMSRVDLGFSP